MQSQAWHGRRHGHEEELVCGVHVQRSGEESDVGVRRESLLTFEYLLNHLFAVYTLSCIMYPLRRCRFHALGGGPGRQLPQPEQVSPVTANQCLPPTLGLRGPPC